MSANNESEVSTDSTTPRVMSITLMTIGLGTVIMNVLVITIFVSYKWMRSNANVIICSMAVTDLMAGLVTFTAGAVKWTDWFEVKGLFCQIFYTVDGWSAMASLAHVLVVNGERYLAIVFPLKYKQMVFPKKIWVALACTWIITLAEAIAYTLANTLGDQCLLVEVAMPALAFGILILSVAIPFVAVIVIYVHIMIVVIQKLRFMATSANLDQAALAGSQRKLFVTVSAILAAWIVCWLPLMCVLVAIEFALTFDIELDMGQFVSLSYYVEVMSYGNSVFNPILYFITSTDFRKAGRLLFKCNFRNMENSQSVETITQTSRL